MDVLESVVAVLSPLREFTDLLAGEKKVTVSAILPLLHHIQNTILTNTPGESNLTKEIKARIKSDLENRYSEEITLFLRVCTFLDPRFKLTQESNTSIIEAIKQTVKDEMELIGQPTTSPAPSTGEGGSNHQIKHTKLLGGKYLVINFLKQMLLLSHCHNVWKRNLNNMFTIPSKILNPPHYSGGNYSITNFLYLQN